MAGLDPECVPWLHARKISVLGSDAVHDPAPPVHMIDGWRIPVHMCALAGMGLHLLDNLHLIDLEKACAAENRWEFFFTVAPLRIERGTAPPELQSVLLSQIRARESQFHWTVYGPDGGPKAQRRAVPVLSGDTEETLSGRILVEEHRIYPEAVRLFAEGRLSIEGRSVHIRESP